MQGTIAERRTFDAFGKPRTERLHDTQTSSEVLLNILNSEYSNRGFTDHEHFDDAQLIHMNGRAYDYNLGRFLSVDPFIQDPGNSQSMNPYSYILNNPLAGTDPSGYRRQSYTQRRGITFEIITGGWNPGADQEDIAMAQYQQCRAGGVGSCVHPYSFDVSGGSDSNQDDTAKKNKAEVEKEKLLVDGVSPALPPVTGEDVGRSKYLNPKGAREKIIQNMHELTLNMQGKHVATSEEGVAEFLDSSLSEFGQLYKIEMSALIKEISDDSFTFVNLKTDFFQGTVDPRTNQAGDDILVGRFKGHVGSWHNHPSDSKGFSKGDIRIGQDMGLNSYVSTRQGVLKHDYRAYSKDLNQLVNDMRASKIPQRHIDPEVESYAAQVVNEKGAKYNYFIMER
ncbi:MAG: hypothetical protein HWE13_12100 [Gammaproteobacteria bacterium]|nr:hypothetical protein [Gammaproteobacteria bacterium]